MIVTVCSTKGGVGKTTLTANLGGLLADAGYRILMVDADVQPTLSTYYPIERQVKFGLHHLLTQGTLEGAVSATSIPGLDLVVSDDPEGALENWILHTPDGRVRLRHALRASPHGYDLVLVDTQGAVGPLQDAGVLAADVLLSPVPPEILSAREFSRGLLAMLERLRPMAHLGAPVGHLYAVIYRMDRTVDARRIAEGLRAAAFADAPGAVTILETIIPAAVAWREAATARVPVHRWASRRRGHEAAERLIALARELLPHMDLSAPTETATLGRNVS